MLQHGKVSLPAPNAFPDAFRELIEGKYPKLAAIYRRESRQFNNSITTGAFVCHNQTLSGLHSTFCVQGQTVCRYWKWISKSFFTSADETTQNALAMTRVRLAHSKENKLTYDIYS